MRLFLETRRVIVRPLADTAPSRRMSILILARYTRSMDSIIFAFRSNSKMILPRILVVDLYDA